MADIRVTIRRGDDACFHAVGRGLTFVPMEAIGEHGGMDLARVRSAGEVRQGYTSFRDGDVVFAKITPCFENGKAAIARGLIGGIGYGTTELHVLRPRLADARWLFYLTQSLDFMKWGEASMYGAGGQKRVPPAFVANFEAAVPPPPTQHAIADFLDRKTAAIDGLIAKKQRLIEILQEKRQALITRAVTKGLDPSVPMKDSGIEWLGEIPAHWDVKRLKFTCRLESGHTPSRSEPTYWIENECTIPWVSLNDSRMLASTDYISDTAFSISPRGMANSSAHLIESGAVVFTRDATVGLAAITTRPMAVSQHVIAWVCGPELHNEYLLRVIYSMVPELERLTWGATIKTIGMGDINELSTPVPPLDEQRMLAGWLKDRVGRVDELLRNVSASVDRLREYRQAVITAAVTGQLEVAENIAEEAVA